MGKRTRKAKCSDMFFRMTGRNPGMLMMRAGFPCHKSPHMYQWLWVFILLPFLEEDTLSELAENHGRELRNLCKILMRYPAAFGKLPRLPGMPLFFELLRKFGLSNAPAQSHPGIRIIIGDTKSEKFGRHMESVHKLSDNSGKRYVMGYDYVLVLAVSGNTVFPISFLPGLPKEHPSHRSGNDMARDEIILMRDACGKGGYDPGEVGILSDSAYCVRKVMTAAESAGFRIISKPGNTHKSEFEGELPAPAEIARRTEDRKWKYLEANHCYQRISAWHHVHGDIVLVIRLRESENGKMIRDVIMCDKSFRNAVRIRKCHKKRWKIGMHSEYHKQYLSLGKSQYQKLGAIRSALSCVAISALIVALFRRHADRKTSLRQAVRLITRELCDR